MEEYLPLILDAVAILIVLITALLGCKKGFLRGLVGLISTVAAIVIAYYFSGIVTIFLEDTFQLVTAVEGWLAESVSFDLPISAEEIVAAVVALILFAFSGALLNLIARVLSGWLENIPILGGMNHLLGLVLGAVKGLVYVCVIVLILAVLPIESLQEAFAETDIVAILYNEILLPILGKITEAIG